MNLKNKFIIIFIPIIVTLSIVNLNNPKKTQIYFLTAKSSEISLGNLISISFLSGFIFSSLYYFKNNNQSKKNYIYRKAEENEINLEKDNEIIQEDDNEIFNKNDLRPPERDIRDSQPTISVNYRIIQDVDKDDYKSSTFEENNENSINDGWGEISTDW